jgi:hypothetical protein
MGPCLALRDSVVLSHVVTFKIHQAVVIRVFVCEVK